MATITNATDQVDRFTYTTGDGETETICLDTWQRDQLADPAVVARLADFAAQAINADEPVHPAFGLDAHPSDVRLTELGVVYQDEDWSDNGDGETVNVLDGITFLTDDGAAITKALVTWAQRTRRTPAEFELPPEYHIGHQN